MNPGFLYILRNSAFGVSVVKIGCTKKSPNARANEIYAGATGVPMPFQAAVAYYVADHKQAEKIVHRKLKSYRLNNRREFFRIPLAVAKKIAKSSCEELNRQLNFSDGSEIFLTKEPSLEAAHRATSKKFLESRTDYGIEVSITAIQERPAGTSTLTSEQAERVEILSVVFQDAFPDSPEKWCSDFSRDVDPEPEIIIWEHMAKAYLSFDHDYLCSLPQKEEAFNLLLTRSYRSTKQVLAEHTFKHFTVSAAKRLLSCYELRPKPITIERNPNFKVAKKTVARKSACSTSVKIRN